MKFDSKTTYSKPEPPSLRFSTKAWIKLHQARDNDLNVEVSGFGICEDQDDLLFVTDFITVPQECTGASTEMTDDGVADFCDAMIQRGLVHDQFVRIWIHTHPGSSSSPSSMDEETFEKQFGDTPWAVMAILSMTGEWYCRLKFNKGPGGFLEIPVYYPDWGAACKYLDEEEFAAELKRNVKREVTVYSGSSKNSYGLVGDGYGYSSRGLWDQDDDDHDAWGINSCSAIDADHDRFVHHWSPDAHKMHGGTPDEPYYLTLSTIGDVIKVYLNKDFEPWLAEVVDEDDTEFDEFWDDYSKNDAESCGRMWLAYRDPDEIDDETIEVTPNEETEE